MQGIGGAAMSTIAPALLRQVYPSRLVGRGIPLLRLAVVLVGGTRAHSLGGHSFRGRLAMVLRGDSAARHRGPVRRQRDAAEASAHIGSTRVRLLGRVAERDSHRAIHSRRRRLGAGEGAPPVGELHLYSLPLIEIALACVAGVALVRHQRGKTAPLVPLDLLHIPILSLSSTTSICSYVAQTLAYLALPFMLQHQLLRSATVTGLLVTPWPLVIVFVAPLVERLSDRYAPGLIGGIGMEIMAVGLCLLIGMPASPSNVHIVWRVAICGIGFGLYQTPNNRIMLDIRTARAQWRRGRIDDDGAHVALVGGAVVGAIGVLVGIVRVFQTSGNATA